MGAAMHLNECKQQVISVVTKGALNTPLKALLVFCHRRSWLGDCKYNSAQYIVQRM
jgi:hypothetical protein